MALTKVRRGGTDTGITDASDATAITIDSSEQVGIGNTSPVELLTIGSTSLSASRIQFLTSTSGNGTIHFGDGTSADAYKGYINYGHDTDSLEFAAGGAENLRLINSVTGSGFTADSGTSIMSHPITAIRARGQTQTDSYYDFTVDSNGGCYVIAGYSHDQAPESYARFENFQVAHNATYIGVYTSEANGGNGDISLSKVNNTTLRVTFNKNESGGSGSYATVEFVAVFGANPF
jgi:hypothetical protein